MAPSRKTEPHNAKTKLINRRKAVCSNTSLEHNYISYPVTPSITVICSFWYITIRNLYQLDIESGDQKGRHKRNLEAWLVKEKRLQVPQSIPNGDDSSPWNRDDAFVFQKLQEQIRRNSQKHNGRRQFANHNAQKESRDRAKTQFVVIEFFAERCWLRVQTRCIQCAWLRKSNCVIEDNWSGP